MCQIGARMNPTLLIVDDEKHTREGLRASLEESFDVYIAADLSGAMAVLEREQVDVLLTDLRIGAEDGMQLIERALAMPHRPVIVMMTAYGSVDTAVEAMRRGAYDFISKPVNIDRLELMLRRALRSKEVEKEVVELKKQVEKRFGLERLVGESAAMQEIYDTIKQVAPTRATILIQGESGTGKELVAQALHSLSERSKGRFVVVHCAALSPQLLESELFGHEKGAFTGATERRIGRFEQAHGGTLFLDEIGEIDQATQVKLLRVLGEERSFERVGGNASIKADVRLVAATHKDLAKLVQEGKFREDLYFRLNVVPLPLPPLRARKEDLPLLVQAFLKQFSTENGKPQRELTSEAMQAILHHDWPGNVRELRTAIEHGVVMASGVKITLRDLPAAVRNSGRPKDAAAAPHAVPQWTAREERFNLHRLEDRAISQALAEVKGNVTQAAKRLGISRRTLHRRIKAAGGDTR
jgi:two-component system response regulator AtoC